MRFRFIISVLLLISLTSLSVSSSGVSYEAAMQTLASVDVSADAFIVYCLDTDEAVYAANEHKKLPMASTTKIMTAIVVLESMDTDDTVKVAEEAVGTEGSSAYLMKGETISIKDLLYALMLESANDAAVALAIHVGGDLDTFVSMMNDKAVDIGMKNTRFANPHGLDDAQHYSTACDMALLCEYAMQNPEFAEISGSYRYETDKRLFVNHNRLIKTCEGVVAGKTGYTKRSGRCLVSVAQRQGVSMCIVTLSDPDDWRDHTKLYDAAFDIYTQVTLEDKSYTVPVINGALDSVEVFAAESQTVIKNEHTDGIEVRVICDRFLYAPIAKGERVGYLVYSCNGREITRSELIARSDVNKIKNKTIIERIFSFIFQD